MGLYNGALRLCKSRRLASLSDGNEPRRLLDDAWGTGATGGSVKHCLQLGQWTFASRAASLAYDPGIATPFGYQYAIEQPDDMIRVTALCSDAYFRQPLLDYVDERGYWYADLQTIYVKWVSSGATYGGDLAEWPESFAKVVEAHLANEIVHNLTTDDKLKLFVEKQFDKALKSAKSLDGMNKPTQFAPEGSWSRARRGAGIGGGATGGSGGSASSSPTDDYLVDG